MEKKNQLSNEWTQVFSSSFQPRIDLMKGLLNEHNIRSIVLNQQDSSYRTFGEIKLFVLKTEIIRAKRIISEFEI